MARVLFLSVIFAFLVLQVTFGKLTEGMTYFAILAYLQLSFLSYRELFRRGFLYESTFFSVSYLLCVLVAVGFSSLGIKVAIYSVFLITLMNLFVVLNEKQGFVYLVSKDKLNKKRIVLAAVLPAPFLLIISLAIPAYYQGLEEAPLVIYFSGYMYGFSFLVSKRVAGLYKREIIGSP